MAKKNENEVFTFRTRPDGDGRQFVGAKYNADGEEVEVVTGRHNTEPDAEKELRGIVGGMDVIAVDRMNVVDKDDNDNIVYETSAPEEVKKFGATIKYAPAPEAEKEAEPTAADQAVAEGLVAPAAAEAEPTEAELKAREKSAEKSRKDDEKAEKEANS